MTVRVDGFDLSHWQDGAMDFHRAKASGAKFCYHKATDGTSMVDPRYAQRRAQAKAAGILFGAYHFVETGGASAAAQAAHFLSVAQIEPGDLWPALDFESDTEGLTVAERTVWVREFVYAVEQAVPGAKMVIYTPFTFNRNWGGLPLWRARYSDQMYDPGTRRPWEHWTIWQFSNGVYPHQGPHSVPGIGNCDLNTIAGDDPDGFLAGITIGQKPQDPPKHGSDHPLVYDAKHGAWIANQADKHAIELTQALAKAKPDSKVVANLLDRQEAHLALGVGIHDDYNHYYESLED